MNTKKIKKSQCFTSLHLGGRGGGSAQKDQRFTFFIDIELWTQSLTENGPVYIVATHPLVSFISKQVVGKECN